MKIPILRIPFKDSERAFIQNGMNQILDSGMLTMGRFTAEFEERFAAFTGAHQAVACSNGTAALELILRGLGIEGRSVIVPTNTFLATAFAVMHAGNRVVFADSDPETLCLDVKDVARRIEPDTAAVILVHIGGIITSAVYELQRLCRDRGLHLIEDCAHAHGCTIDGRKAGTLGTAGAFSFFPTKVLTTGEGGMVTTGDDALACRMRMIRNHGKNPAMGNRMSEFGYNLRMSEFTALLGVQQMNRAEEVLVDRRRAAAFYDTALAGVPGIRSVRLPENVVSTYYKYICYLDERFDRTAVKRHLREKYDVSLTGEVYADLCHTEPLWQSYTYCGARRGERVHCGRWPACECDQMQTGYPGSEYLARHHVCLPLYSGLTDGELEYTVSSLRIALKELSS